MRKIVAFAISVVCLAITAVALGLSDKSNIAIAIAGAVMFIEISFLLTTGVMILSDYLK